MQLDALTGVEEVREEVALARLVRLESGVGSGALFGYARYPKWVDDCEHTLRVETQKHAQRKNMLVACSDTTRISCEKSITSNFFGNDICMYNMSAVGRVTCLQHI